MTNITCRDTDDAQRSIYQQPVGAAAICDVNDSKSEVRREGITMSHGVGDKAAVYLQTHLRRALEALWSASVWGANRDDPSLALAIEQTAHQVNEILDGLANQDGASA